MKKVAIFSLTLITLFSVFLSCKKNDSGTGGSNPCDTTNIVVSGSTTPNTPCGNPNGTVTATASGSSGFTYSINGGAFQASNIFQGVNAGSSTITAKDANGCTGSITVNVGTTAPGTQFAAMRNLISTRCSGSGCHIGGQIGGGYNFDSDCSIISSWSVIQTECITRSSMPKIPQPALTLAEKTVITSWISGGHTYSN